MLMVEVARGPAPLAVQAAHGQVDLLQRSENLFDLLGQDQCRQVEHDAGAHAGADVGGASRQVAELLAEGVVDALLEQVVEAVDVLPALVEGEAAADDLQAQVIFFVDHDADGLGRRDGDAAWPLGVGQLAANKLPLDQELAIEREQAGEVDVFEARVVLEFADLLAEDLVDLVLLVGAGPAGERERRQVAGQADTAGDDDVRLRTGATQPFPV